MRYSVCSMKEWKIALLIMIWPALLAGGVYFMYQRATKPRIEVRNFSGTKVDSIVVDYAPSLANGGSVKEASLGDLGPGGATEFNFPEGDFFVNIAFSRDGKRQQFECGLIGDVKAGMLFMRIEPDAQNSRCTKFSVLEAGK
jgi:hypothetical protein